MFNQIKFERALLVSLLALSIGCSKLEEQEPAKVKITYLEVPEDQADVAGSMSEIYIDGEITGTILTKVKEIVDKNKLEKARIILNSLGGEIGAATEIGQYIRENNFATDVGTMNEKWGNYSGGECHSACTLTYLGGKYRFFGPGSKFGVHRFYSDSLESSGSALEAEAETQEYSSLIVSYIREMGVDVSMFNKMSEQSSDDIELLDIDEMRKMNIVNDGALAPVWEYSIDENGVALIGHQDKLDQFGVIGISCDPGPIISFTSSINPDLKNVSLTSSLLLDDEVIEFSDSVIEKEFDTENSLLTVLYKPNANTLLKILSAEIIGYSYGYNDDTYEFTTDIRSADDKKKISNFIQYCKS